MAADHRQFIGRLEGAFTALITPFAAPDAATVDLDRLEANIRQQAKAGIRGVVPCGTTGETPTLSDEEYHAVVTKTIEIAKPLGMMVIVGAGSNSTAQAVTLHKYAHAVGADGALHVTPYYNKPSQKGLYFHFLTIADSIDLPIVLYNIPGRTGVNLDIETIELLAQHRNIVAIKDATGSLASVNDLIDRTDLTILSGDDPLTLPMGSVGASGVISVLGNVVPEQVAALCQAILDCDLLAARTVHQQLLPLARGLLTLDTNPVPVKTAMAQLGRDTGLVRLPLIEPSDDAYEKIAELLSRRTATSPAAAADPEASSESSPVVEVPKSMASHARST